MAASCGFHATIAHGLAEKHCGAQPKPMRKKILDFIEENGCGPGTTIYSETEDSISKVEGADLGLLIRNGDKDLAMSPQQVRAAAEKMANSLGGCAALIKAHGAD